MAYEPTNWKAGDIVTSAKLNKIEQGITSHNMVEAITDDENSIVTLNKTWQEIWDNNYMRIMSTYTNKNNDSIKYFSYIKELISGENVAPYMVTVDGLDVGGSTVTFTCNSPDDYPSYDPSYEAL